MKSTYLLPLILCAALSTTQAQVTKTDGDWAQRKVTLLNTPEAEYMFRVGDVDNLGFGWGGDEFDPFCGRSTDPHGYPWDPAEDELPGLDRILLSSHFNPQNEAPCSGDGYSGYDPSKTKPQAFSFDLSPLKGKEIRNAQLKLFIDDFQAPIFCSQYTLTLNGTRFVEAERMLNAIEQTGPVGKMVTLEIPEEFFPALASGSLSVFIDETKGVPDGFALDFLKLIVNRKLNTNCIGSIQGMVLDKGTRVPIAGATVNAPGLAALKADAEGIFWLKDVPTGLSIVGASAPGYADGFGMADIAKGDENTPFEILLEQSALTAKFDGKSIGTGQSITLNKILFDQGKADLRPESQTELDKIVAFLVANPRAQIELSGHTSSEGDAAMNRSLSYRRVKACKDYIVAKGIDTGAIITVGLGPDRPVAPNDTEANRALNRRVEMRVLRL